MNIPKYGLSKLYIPSTILSLLLLAGYYFYKFLKYYDGNYIYNFNLLSLIIFIASIILLLLLFFKFRIKSKTVFLLLFVTLASFIILSYDFILPPSNCPDCIGNIRTGKIIREKGFVSFLKNYHKPTLYKIKKSPQMYKRFLQYENKLKVNYKKQFNSIENDTSDIKPVPRTGHHPPLWFSTISLWQTFFGDSYFSHRMLAKLEAALYLISLYFFLGLFFKREEYRSKLLILSVVLLLPTFLLQATRAKSDLILGTLVTLNLFYLLENKKNNICQKDFLVGFFYSIAVLFKLTSLTLLLLIALYYLISFKHKAIPKLFVVIVSSAVLPLLLYTIFGYDLILNVITGRIAQLDNASAKGVYSGMYYTVHWLIYGQYAFGIPLILLLITHIFKIRQYLAQYEVLTFYLFITFFCMICIFLWGSHLPRHLVGYLPLTIPLLVYIYNNCYEKSKMLLSTNIFLIVSNLLILINRYIRLNTIKGLIIME